MSNYKATVQWYRNGEDFLNNKYSRGHEWAFDGGTVVAASASPHIVPLPWSIEANVDPEEGYIASISSCHMLFFLSIAANRGFQIDSYVDESIGEMSKNEAGKWMVSKVTLKPQVDYSGEKQPDSDTASAMHHEAHQECFIANSIRTEVVVSI
ncbi:MAG: OsmC family peroxiredoxin [Pseudomonadales bacterium]|nr:OsmC family peroxiredoxin [Pseudomonadales bacterium]